MPDGSAFPHLLLAGIAQAARAALKIDHKDDLLKRMHTDAAQQAQGQSIPKGSDAVADLLIVDREMYQSDSVFPATLIDAEIGRLRTDARNEQLQAL